METCHLCSQLYVHLDFSQLVISDAKFYLNVSTWFRSLSITKDLLTDDTFWCSIFHTEDLGVHIFICSRRLMDIKCTAGENKTVSQVVGSFQTWKEKKSWVWIRLCRLVTYHLHVAISLKMIISNNKKICMSTDLSHIKGPEGLSLLGPSDTWQADRSVYFLNTWVKIKSVIWANTAVLNFSANNDTYFLKIIK